MITINRHPTPSQLRWFSALWFPLFGLAAGGMLYWRAHELIARAVWATVAVGTVLSLVSADIAQLLFVGLSYASYPIGFVVSWVALAAVYFLVLSPIALVMRLAGRDVLRLRYRHNAGSDWIERRPNEDDATRAFRQF
jgi:hypothetical protein